MNTILVLYDGLCPSCRLLASLLAIDGPSHWQMQAWQNFQDKHQGPPGMLEHPQQPKELCLRVGNEWLEGEAAWLYLLKFEPRLQVFQNIAAKIGLAPPISARWLRRLGHGIRRLCRACSHRGI